MTISDLIYRLGQNLGRGGTGLADILQQKGLIHIDGDLTTPVSSIIYLGGSYPSVQNTPATTQTTAHRVPPPGGSNASAQNTPATIDPLATIDLPFLSACAEGDAHLAAAEPLAQIPRPP